MICYHHRLNPLYPIIINNKTMIIFSLIIQTNNRIPWLTVTPQFIKLNHIILKKKIFINNKIL